MDEEPIIITTFANEPQINDNDADADADADAASPTSDVDEWMNAMNQIYKSIMEGQHRERPFRKADEHKKTDEKAKHYRELGIIAYKEGRRKDAFVSFAQSLASAPEGSLELAETYKERACVLVKEGRYEVGRVDAKRAEQAKYRPTGESHDANSKDDDDDSDEWHALSTFVPSNPVLSNASSKIKLSKKKVMKAIEDIEPGEILLIEKDQVMSLDPKRRFTNCAYCLMSCDTLIPCPGCTQRLYCSSRCRTSAYDSYHRIECRMIKFYDSQLPPDLIKPIVIQTFLRGTKQGAELPTLMAELDPIDIFNRPENAPEKLFTGAYVELLKTFDLSFSLIIMSVAVVLPSIVKAILMLRELSFFPRGDKWTSDRLSEEEQFAGLLLLNNQIASKFTRFEISEEIFSDETSIGQGVCSFYRSFPYSCNANTYIVIKNRQFISFATRPINSGEVLTYSPNQNDYAIYTKEERLKMFALTAFRCSCEACFNDWPALPDLSKLKIRFLKRGKWELLEELEKSIRTVTMGKPLKKLTKNEVLRIIIDHLKLLKDNIDIKPSFVMAICERMLVEAVKGFYSDFHRYKIQNDEDVEDNDEDVKEKVEYVKEKDEYVKEKDEDVREQLKKTLGMIENLLRRS